MADDANTLYGQADVLAASQATPLPPPASVDYTAWDYESIRAMLIALARQRFADKYNNFTEQDYGVMIIEYLAAIADMLSFKLDYLINEAFLPTALLPKSVRRHARRVGYMPRPRQAARYDFTLSVEEPFTVDVEIEPGRRVMTPAKDGQVLSVELYLADDSGSPLWDQPLVIPAGTTGITNVVGIEGETRNIEMEGAGEAFQVFSIVDNQVLTESIGMWVDDSEWQRVEALVDEGPLPIYRVDQDDRTQQWYLVVGDGEHGSTVPAGARVRIRYRTGGGERGNVPSGFINVSTTVVVSGARLSVPIVAINRSQGRGGDDGEGTNEIRMALPQWYRTQYRLVTLDDYTLYASRYNDANAGRVARARAYLRHAACSANIIDIYLVEYVARDEWVQPSDRLLQGVRTAVEPLKVATHEVCVKPGIVVYVDLQIHGTLASGVPTSRRSDLERQIRTAVDNFFDPGSWNFGRTFTAANLQRALGSIREVEDFEILVVMDPGYRYANDQYATRHWEIIRPRTIEITVESASAL